MPHTMMSFPLTLAPILDRAASLYPNVEIVSRRPDRTLARTTYGEVSRRARLLARALVGAGLRRGERVATLMWNHSVHLEAYFGIPLAGGVVHTLNLRLASAQLAFIATHAEDRFLIVDDVLLPVLEAFRAQAPFERIFVHHVGGSTRDAFEDYETLLRGADTRTELPAIGDEDGAAMCYTSGTTGDPKGVIYSHRALAVHSLMSGLADSFGLSHQDVLLAAVPMFHANAWGLPFTATMTGTKQVLPGPHLDATSVLELLESERVTISAGVPTVWLGVCERLAASARRWNLVPGLRVLSGGSAPSEALIRRLDAHGIRLVQPWGLTETTPLATISTLRPHHHDACDDERYAIRAQQGSAVPFVELRVCNEEGEVPRDGATMGEAQLRGPCIAASYFKMPELATNGQTTAGFGRGTS